MDRIIVSGAGDAITDEELRRAVETQFGIVQTIERLEGDRAEITYLRTDQVIRPAKIGASKSFVDEMYSYVGVFSHGKIEIS